MPKELYKQIVDSFGKRENNQRTSALGIDGDGKYYGCIQGTSLKGKLAKQLIDAGKITMEGLGRTYGEMTGFHAEMMIVYAWKIALGIEASDKMSDMIKDFQEAMAKTKYKHGVIAANAPCCKHCKNMLEILGIKYYGKGAKASLTAWWNPFTEKVIPNGDMAFKDAIPEAPKKYGY